MILLLLVLSAGADQVAAIVGEEIILESEVSATADIIAAQPLAQSVFENADTLRSYAVQQLISRKLLLVQAEIESISVSNDELQSQVKDAIENLKSKFPSESDFLKELEKENLTVDDLWKKYEDDARFGMIMNRLVQKKFMAKIMISPIAVRDFYEKNKDSIATVPGRVKLAHILLAIRPSEDALKKGFERAVEVYSLLMSGGDFGVIAQEFSDDRESRVKGGMLGKVKKGETLQEFEAAIFSLKPGVISQPIPTRLGYHVVEVLNKGPDWVLARQILLKVETTREDTLRYEKLAHKIKTFVQEGTNFDSLAKEYSSVPYVDLGEFFIKQFTPPYDEVVQNLEQGQVSEPIPTPDGFHLLYAREKVPEKSLTFEDLRDQINDYLYQQELQKLYERLIDELKSKTFVKIFPKK